MPPPFPGKKGLKNLKNFKPGKENKKKGNPALAFIPGIGDGEFEDDEKFRPGDDKDDGDRDDENDRDGEGNNEEASINRNNNNGVGNNENGDKEDEIGKSAIGKNKALLLDQRKEGNGDDRGDIKKEETERKEEKKEPEQPLKPELLSDKRKQEAKADSSEKRKPEPKPETVESPTSTPTSASSSISIPEVAPTPENTPSSSASSPVAVSLDSPTQASVLAQTENIAFGSSALSVAVATPPSPPAPLPTSMQPPACLVNPNNATEFVCLVDSFYCDTASLSCLPKLAIGSTCQSSSQCQSNICDRGHCAQSSTVLAVENPAQNSLGNSSSRLTGIIMGALSGVLLISFMGWRVARYASRPGRRLNNRGISPSMVLTIGDQAVVFPTPRGDVPSSADAPNAVPLGAENAYSSEDVNAYSDVRSAESNGARTVSATSGGRLSSRLSKYSYLAQAFSHMRTSTQSGPDHDPATSPNGHSPSRFAPIYDSLALMQNLDLEQQRKFREPVSANSEEADMDGHTHDSLYLGIQHFVVKPVDYIAIGRSTITASSSMGGADASKRNHKMRTVVFESPSLPIQQPQKAELSPSLQHQLQLTLPEVAIVSEEDKALGPSRPSFGPHQPHQGAQQSLEKRSDSEARSAVDSEEYDWFKGVQLPVHKDAWVEEDQAIEKSSVEKSGAVKYSFI
ncbi:uncharacterized protein VTP21DRAFT_10652 [Calcarisporiella thermophila]|uniref:uncharacterized protein n=1 Tax=Calcarisporiella thermophila TaxID=911321 RepID=UPI0037427181